jgi:type I restriction enzyme M protein
MDSPAATGNPPGLRLVETGEMALKKSELYSSLWSSCDELRGGMDASQYKDYVLVLLFIKYVSDKYAGVPYAPIVIPPGASFKDMADLKGKSDIGDQINKKIIAPLASANKLSDFPDFNDATKLGSGQEMRDKLTNLIAIFESPSLDFSKNRADGDDILGDAYEYLMRHFATESGKSKGQFYTPAEVSRIMAQVLGVGEAKTTPKTTIYDPTCGSGSLLLKIADAAKSKLTLYGQEKDSATSGLARMNMILHNNPEALIVQGNTLTDPKFLDNSLLKTFDYVVANPPFSDKRWSSGMHPNEGGRALAPGEKEATRDYGRFEGYGVPPSKQGDYAYLLHILRSLKTTGKGACILPHGVLFRGNAEATIRKNLVRRGYIKGIIGLPANLFYGTGIPACIIVIDKEGAAFRKGIFLIDASKGLMKDGPKNRLREQDIHRIVDTFTRQMELPGYSRMVPVAEISDAKNDFNLNLPRYIDSSESEDLQDIDAHLRGGIPDRDIDALKRYWDVIPGVRAALFKDADRPGYTELRIPAEIKTTIFGHSEFTAFTESATKLFTKWKKANAPLLNGLKQGDHPKQLIKAIAEDLLAIFQKAPLLDPYDIYQHLMDYWAETMQDDCYLIVGDGWKAGALPHEIRQVKNKDGKLVWPETHDYKKGKRRFKSDLIPATVLIARYFTAERDAIAAIETDVSALEQQLDEMREEQSGEDGLLAEVIEGEGEKQKITAKAVKIRLKEIGQDSEYGDERRTLEEYLAVLDKLADTKEGLRTAQEKLEAMIDAKYPRLSEAEIKTLVVDDKWLATLASAVQGELGRVSLTLTCRIRQLAERYAYPLPELTDELTALSLRVDEHLRKMGAVWN